MQSDNATEPYAHPQRRVRRRPLGIVPASRQVAAPKIWRASRGGAGEVACRAEGRAAEMPSQQADTAGPLGRGGACALSCGHATDLHAQPREPL